MKNNNLLVISNGFPELDSARYHCQFVYEQTKLIQNLYSEITVISPQPYFPSLLQKIPGMAGYSKLSGFHNYREGNMRVIYPTFFTLPIEKFREHNNLPIARAIAATIKREQIKYDTVHVHFLYPTGEAALSVLPPQIPKVLSLHGGDVYEWAENPKHIKRARAIWRAYDKLQVPSKYLANELRKLDPELPKDKIQIITPSVDDKLFYPSAKKSKTPIVLMVANLVEGKGHIDGLVAFKRVLADIPEAKLKIIGTGPLYSTIKRKIREMGLETAAQLVGPVPHSKLPTWYRSAAVLLFPSYAESFGIVQMEALACGTSVIAYENEGSRAVLAKYPEFLVRVGDIAQLSKKLRQVLS